LIGALFIHTKIDIIFLAFPQMRKIVIDCEEVVNVNASQLSISRLNAMSQNCNVCNFEGKSKEVYMLKKVLHKVNRG
jgi:hypothetical protein